MKIKKILQKKVRISLFLLLLVSILVTVFIIRIINENQNLRFEKNFTESISDLDLKNGLVYDYDDDHFYGEVIGFVLFNDIKKQPKNLRQYYKISATNNFDQTGKQIFKLTEFVKVEALPVSQIGDSLNLFIKDNTESILTLEDKFGNVFRLFIQKEKIENKFYGVVKKVNMVDIQNDEISLIMSNYEFSRLKIHNINK